jgi:hypothetical protein
MTIDRIEREGVNGIHRRQLLKRGAGLAVAGGGLPWVLAACGAGEGGSAPASRSGGGDGEVVVGDVLDFALRSDEWEGDFGYVTMRLHEGVVDGESVWFIRTDASDESFASEQGLVFAPKIAALNAGRLSGEMVLVDDGPAVLSSHPARDDYTPAWRVRRATWRSEPRQLTSLGDVRSAGRSGELTLEDAATVVNAAVIQWPGGALGVDRALEEYLGDRQLIEPPDTRAGEVKFKLHECFPSSRYIVTDHSFEMPAEMTSRRTHRGCKGDPARRGRPGR